MSVAMDVGSGGRRRGLIPLDFETFSKKVAFLASSGKNQISTILATPLEKISKIPWCPPWKKSFRRACQWHSTVEFWQHVPETKYSELKIPAYD